MATRPRSGAGVISWERFRGRNGTDDPAMLPADMGTEAVNWLITSQGLGARRRGTQNAGVTGANGWGSMARFIPAQDESAAELVFATFDNPPKFMTVKPANAPAAVEIPQTDTVWGLPIPITYAAGNGKLFCAYRNASSGVLMNRLHVYDPATGNAIRRAGVTGPPAPTVDNHGIPGTYPPVLRYYRVQFKSAGGAISALGTASAAFTPSGTNDGVRVTLPAYPAAENVTHARVYGSADGTLYYLLSGWIAGGVGFYDDFALPSTYGTRPAAPLEGSRYPLPSARFLLWDGYHLLLFGTFGDQAGNALPAVPGRVYITQSLDATAEGGEDESITMTDEVKGYVDLNRNGNAEDRAIAGPIDGNILVFQSRGVFMLKPTGSAQRPYARIALSRELGALSHWSTFVGEDESGRPAIYFLDPDRGPYRYGYAGFEWLGYDVQDLWKNVNLAALHTVACGVYDARERRCYWWIATGDANYTTMGLTFHVAEARPTPSQGVRYGWTQFNGYACNCYCTVMFAETIGNPMARKLKPYVGDHTRLVQFDAPNTNTDFVVFDGVPARQPYVSLVRSKAWVTSALPQLVELHRAWIRGPCADAILAQRLLRNFGDDEARLSTVPLHPEGDESRRVFLFEEAMLAGAWTFQTELGDAVAADQHYEIDRWDARMTATDLEVGSSTL